jgi:hypothetical protein
LEAAEGGDTRRAGHYYREGRGKWGGDGWSEGEGVVEVEVEGDDGEEEEAACVLGAGEAGVVEVQSGGRSFTLNIVNQRDRAVELSAMVGLPFALYLTFRMHSQRNAHSNGWVK